MSFTVDEFRDLISILEQQPEWRAELRRWVLTEELLALPQVVQDLAEAQRRTEASLDRLTERVDQLTVRMDQFAERMDQRVERMETDLGRLKGSDLERRYRERGHSYFSRLLRRPHVLSSDELVTLIEDAVTQGQFREDEADDLFQADVIVRGRSRDDDSTTYLVVEVSWGVGLSDAQRASSRAVLLTRLGFPVLPVVAGTWINSEAQEVAHALQVWQLIDGRLTPPNS